jgi:hypothetical protein
MRRARKGKKKITTLIDTEGCTSRHSPRGDAEHAKLQLCAAVSIRPGGRRTLLGKHQPDASFPVHFGIPTKSFFFRMLPGKQFVNYRHARAERERERAKGGDRVREFRGRAPRDDKEAEDEKTGTRRADTTTTFNDDHWPAADVRRGSRTRRLTWRLREARARRETPHSRKHVCCRIFFWFLCASECVCQAPSAGQSSFFCAVASHAHRDRCAGVIVTVRIVAICVCRRLHGQGGLLEETSTARRHCIPSSLTDVFPFPPPISTFHLQSLETARWALSVHIKSISATMTIVFDTHVRPFPFTNPQSPRPFVRVRTCRSPTPPRRLRHGMASASTSVAARFNISRMPSILAGLVEKQARRKLGRRGCSGDGGGWRAAVGRPSDNPCPPHLGRSWVRRVRVLSLAAAYAAPPPPKHARSSGSPHSALCFQAQPIPVSSPPALPPVRCSRDFSQDFFIARRPGRPPRLSGTARIRDVMHRRKLQFMALDPYAADVADCADADICVAPESKASTCWRANLSACRAARTGYMHCAATVRGGARYPLPARRGIGSLACVSRGRWQQQQEPAGARVGRRSHLCCLTSHSPLSRPDSVLLSCLGFSHPSL